ncbi:hypothetical protein BC939DRAFT_213021 [Gamsiella multidivaricata]|uniref:uncharacterized protein n=1 Tax=Gamsiella multidivaricata TaxID=101098 RepID=UPI00221F5C55|nr:uncharacterized protein BC939DRAFT_213021 [Gamsiella multidivaricata]KAI7820922.1 hypothetical protein BC939DRAFT_213021 [Gamsiella multidivaricata]
MIFTNSLLVSSILVALASVVTAAPAKVTGQTAAVISAKKFCIFLPPKYGGGISESEDSAVAFCTEPISSAPKAGTLPAGFIKTTHFVTNTQKGYVQVTGRIDRSKYGLSSKDGGGQYDIKAPVGSKCAGYNYYVELVEPDSQRYCIRCCKNKADCPVNKSTYGCEAVLGGDYS